MFLNYFYIEKLCKTTQFNNLKSVLTENDKVKFGVEKKELGLIKKQPWKSLKFIYRISPLNYTLITKGEKFYQD